MHPDNDDNMTSNTVFPKLAVSWFVNHSINSVSVLSDRLNILTS